MKRQRDLSLSICSVALCVAGTMGACLAQTASPVTLNIGVEAAAPRLHSPSGLAALSTMMSGRIVQVNGQPAGGTWTGVSGNAVPIGRAGPLVLTAIGINRNLWTFVIDEADGTPAGTIVAAAGTDNEPHTIISGTNAYLGINGTISRAGPADNSPVRVWPQAAIDAPGILPSRSEFTATMQPVTTPVIASSPTGALAIAHAADSSPVTAAQPAQPGETLTAYAWDLVPELSGDTSAPPPVLPVRISIGDVEAQVLYAGRYLGGGDGYQINVRMPLTGVAVGFAQLRIDSGFLPGVPVILPVGAGQ